MALKLKTKLNKGLIQDTLIASIISDYAPAILNKFMFSNNPLSGMTLQLASAGVVYLAGGLFKKPNVASIGVALAASNLVGGVVGQAVAPLLGTSSASLTATKTANKSVADYVRIAQLNDWVPAPTKAAGYSQYHE